MLPANNPENLFRGSQDQLAQNENPLSTKREHYRIEIRNKDRQEYFKARQEQFRMEQYQSQQQFSEEQIIQKEIQKNSLVEDVRRDLINTNPNTIYQLVGQYVANDNDDKNTLQQLKAYYQCDYPIYELLWNNYVQQYGFVRRILDNLVNGKCDEICEVSSYHLNNIIYYGTKQIREWKDLNLLLEVIGEQLLDQRQQNKYSMQIKANLLFCLANLYGEDEIGQYQYLNSHISQLINALFKLTKESNILNKYHINFTNGILWLLRNLIYQQNQAYEPNGRISLLICEYLWPDIQKYLKQGVVGFQIGEDLLFIISHVAKSQTDDELNQLFDLHINLMIGIISHSWDTTQYQNLILAIKYIAMGQDDVIESLIQLGALEILNLLFQDSLKNQQYLHHVITTIGHFICSDDQTITDKVIENLGAQQFLKDLLNCTQLNKSQIIIEEAVHTIGILIKNYESIIPQLLELKLVQQIFECLKNNLSNEIQLDCLELILTLLEWENQDYSEQIKQLIYSMNGVDIINQLMDNNNILIVEFTQKIISQLQE